MKKLVVIAFLLIPSLAHAAWWDVSAWFKSKQIEMIAGSAEAIPQATSTPEPIVIEKEVIKEVPVEKIIEKIVEKPVYIDRVVSDDALVSENAELKKQLDILKSQTAGKDAVSGSWEVKYNDLNIKYINAQEVIKNLQNVPKDDTAYQFFKKMKSDGGMGSSAFRDVCRYEEFNKNQLSGLTKICDEWRAEPNVRG